MSRIFINYRRQDSEGYVGRLYDHLLKYFAKHDLFMDVTDLRPGINFVDALEEAVAACDVLLAIIGPAWIDAQDDTGERRLDAWNDFVRLEIASAIKQEKLVIPVLVGRAKMPAPDQLPEDIQGLAWRNAVELDHTHFANDVERLVEAVKQAVPANSSFKRDTPPHVLEKKQEALKQLRIELVGATDSPLYPFRTENRYFPVLGEGNADANIMFIGEAPGKREAEQGIPFVGPSGEVLDDMLGTIGLKRADVYMTNVVLDRTPDNRDPVPDELAFYETYVDRMIDIIRPAVIATLGRFAMYYLLKKLNVPEKRGKISQQHGKLIKAQLHYGEIHVVPLFHPAVVLYSASKKAVVQQDFEKLKLFI